MFFEKEGAADKGPIGVEIGKWGIPCTFVLEVEQNFMQSLSTFLLFFMTKKLSF